MIGIIYSMIWFLIPYNKFVSDYISFSLYRLKNAKAKIDNKVFDFLYQRIKLYIKILIFITIISVISFISILLLFILWKQKINTNSYDTFNAVMITLLVLFGIDLFLYTNSFFTFKRMQKDLKKYRDYNNKLGKSNLLYHKILDKRENTQLNFRSNGIFVYAKDYDMQQKKSDYFYKIPLSRHFHYPAKILTKIKDIQTRNYVFISQDYKTLFYKNQPVVSGMFYDLYQDTLKY
ncbi:hypothetical protein ACR82Z_02825 [Mycoplasma sp. 6243]|uniref:hypothetical protein n=1 Tax=Mycoplasma sp. 6243 TaxID=3440865 RepID=UPI003EBB75DA